MMTIEQKNATELTVSGNIKTIDDSIALRAAVQKLVDGGCSSVTLRIADSFAMPSAVIGYLMKLVNRDKVQLHVIAGDQRLRELLDELQLSELFGVRER
jgi:hypothetical protein